MSSTRMCLRVFVLLALAAGWTFQPVRCYEASSGGSCSSIGVSASAACSNAHVLPRTQPCTTLATQQEAQAAARLFEKMGLSPGKAASATLFLPTSGPQMRHATCRICPGPQAILAWSLRICPGPQAILAWTQGRWWSCLHGWAKKSARTPCPPPSRLTTCRRTSWTRRGPGPHSTAQHSMQQHHRNPPLFQRRRRLYPALYMPPPPPPHPPPRGRSAPCCCTTLS